MNKKEYITLQEATKYCDYSQEYLSLRARQGKLKAIKLKRNWLTKKEWLREYLKQPSNYISLKQAAERCDYSHDYLSLRARQGKLKAVKLGKNWLTKKEWLDRYLKKHQREVKQEIIKTEVVKILPPPDNLPVEEFQPTSFLLRKRRSRRRLASSVIKMLRIGALSILVASLLIVGVLASKDFLSKNLVSLYKVSEEFLENNLLPVIEKSSVLKSAFLNIADVSRTTGQILKEYFSWLGDSFKNIFQKSKQAY